VTGYCASQELCLRPRPDGGCDSSPPFGLGAKPSWCPAAGSGELASVSPGDNVTTSATPCKADNAFCRIDYECCSGRCGLGAVASRRCAANRLASGGSGQASAALITMNATEGRCCFNGCDDGSSCVTGYCASQELCLRPRPDGGCDSSPPFGLGAKPSWCPAAVSVAPGAAGSAQ